MSSYRSAYEEYYKNINNIAGGKKDKSKYSTAEKRKGNPINFRYGNNRNDGDTIVSILIKRIIKELTGATILLLFFVGLKYISTDQIKEMHVKFKQILNYNISYTDCIDAIDTVQIGNVNGADLQMDNLKKKAYDFIEYIKKTDNMQN